MQPALFDDPPQRRSKDGEVRYLWCAIRFLRLKGHRVYRAGNSHKIDGSIRTSKQLIQIARARGFK